MNQPELTIWRVYLQGRQVMILTKLATMSLWDVRDELYRQGWPAPLALVQCQVDGTPVYRNQDDRFVPCLKHLYRWTDTSRLEDSMYRCVRCGTYHPEPRFPERTIAAVHGIERLCRIST